MKFANLLACALWLAACMGLGVYMGRRQISRAQELEGFHRLFSTLCDTVLPLSMTIPQACERFSAQNTGAASVFARELAAHLRQEPLTPSRYREILQGIPEAEVIFAEESIRNLLEEGYACMLAKSGRELESILKRCEHQWGLAAEKARKTAENKSALYRTLGFLAGALALIWAA